MFFCKLCNRSEVVAGVYPHFCPYRSCQEEAQSHFRPQAYLECVWNTFLNDVGETSLSDLPILLDKTDQKEDQNIKLISQPLKNPQEWMNQVLNQDHPKSGSDDLQYASEEVIDVSEVGAQSIHSQMQEQEQILKLEKNQYDKNIPGNIVSTVLVQMASGKYSEEIKYYCKNLNTSLKQVMDFVNKNQEAKKKIGTSWIGNCFRGKNAKNEVHRVFAMFMIRFLRQEYHLLIISTGKMREKQKYLECAISLMYIPRLQKYQYELISRFQ